MPRVALGCMGGGVYAAAEPEVVAGCACGERDAVSWAASGMWTSARVTGGRRQPPSSDVHLLFCLAGWWAAAFGLPTPISRARLSFVSHSNRCSADCISPSVRESSLYDNSTLYQLVNFCRTQYNHLYSCR